MKFYVWKQFFHFWIFGTIFLNIIFILIHLFIVFMILADSAHIIALIISVALHVWLGTLCFSHMLGPDGFIVTFGDNAVTCAPKTLAIKVNIETAYEEIKEFGIFRHTVYTGRGVNAQSDFIYISKETIAKEHVKKPNMGSCRKR